MQQLSNTRSIGWRRCLLEQSQIRRKNFEQVAPRGGAFSHVPDGDDDHWGRLPPAPRRMNRSWHPDDATRTVAVLRGERYSRSLPRVTTAPRNHPVMRGSPEDASPGSVLKNACAGQILL